MSRYSVSIYTDGPATRWNVIDTQTQEWLRRFDSEEKAKAHAARLQEEWEREKGWYTLEAAYERGRKDLAREVFALAEDTIENYRMIAERDLEGKQGAYARGRIIEAKSIAKAIGAILPARPELQSPAAD